VDRLNLEMNCRVSGGSRLRAQEYELRVGRRTYLSKGAPGDLNGGEADWPEPTSLGRLLLLLALSFSSALHAPLFLCVCVLHGVGPSKLSRPLLCLHD
jgi:hypothetical protein